MLHGLLFVLLGSIVARIGWAVGTKAIYLFNSLVYAIGLSKLTIS